MRTVACARYLCADVLRSQRVLLPVILYAGVLAVLYGGDPGPLPAPWAASALVLYPVATWLALVLANTEEPPARMVTVAAAGGTGRVVAATLAVALAADVLLSAAATIVPVLISHYRVPDGALLLGLCTHLAAAATGTAIGLLVARPLITRIGWSFCIGAVVVSATAVQPSLPPVGTAVRTVTEGAAVPWAPAVLAVVLAAAAAVIVWAVESRR
ncbi:hypothetical protein ACQEVB_10360 [Pseudonocardia sp. CA-107938]|uniref:hypothetical protein n=1 Tax=Pseudonocardia sp. CA-107938 TaxID=3240021 RepID=UPI003D8BF3B2